MHLTWHLRLDCKGQLFVVAVDLLRRLQTGLLHLPAHARSLHDIQLVILMTDAHLTRGLCTWQVVHINIQR